MKEGLVTVPEAELTAQEIFANEEEMVKGNVLDMWRVYKTLSKDNCERLTDYTFYNSISQRKGMVFPDFFHAIDRFLHPSLISPTRLNICKKYSQEQVETLIMELDETFKNMGVKWADYSPFFARHPEIRYLEELPWNACLDNDWGLKLEFLPWYDTGHVFSIVEYHRLRGNIDFYVDFDNAIVKNEQIKTVFEGHSGPFPGDFKICLLPYGKYAEKIQQFLPFLKHGEMIGFARVAQARVDGQTVLAITSLQTDLLRKGKNMPDRTCPIGYREKANNDDKYTVTGESRKYYLREYDWAKQIVSAVEDAVLEASAKTPIAGVIIPTLHSFRKYEEGRGSYINQYDSFSKMAESKYISGIYESFPGKVGYNSILIHPVFPLIKEWENGGTLSESKDAKELFMPLPPRKWWIKTIEEIKKEVFERI